MRPGLERGVEFHDGNGRSIWSNGEDVQVLV